MKRILLALAFVLLSALPSQAALGYYAPITYDHTQVGSSDSTNFPIFFAGNAALKTVANGGLYVQLSNAHDIQFFSDSSCSTLLDYELVTWDATTGLGEWWIRIGTLSHSADGTIYVCVGDSGASDRSNATGVWSTAFKGVWHLGDGSSLSVADSTSNGNNGTNSSATATTGQLDGGAAVTGGSHVVVPFPAITGASTDFTWSFWTQMTANANGFNTLFDSANGSRDWAQFVSSSGAGTFAGTLPPNSGWISGVTAGSLHYVVFTTQVTGGNRPWQVYVDGSATATPANAGIPNVSAQSVDFGDNPSSGGSNWAGKYDELRFQLAHVSADWVTAEYNNQKTSSTLLSLGSFTATGGGGGGSTPQTLPLLGVGPGQ